MTTPPLCIDLFCGLGGWTEGFLAEGYDVIGFDVEQHIYGEHRYPAQLVLQDVRTLHGSQFRDATIIVASSPCQEFSYRAMPWKRAKALGPPLLGMELFAQAARIQREACEAAGRYIPMIQENVRGAQKYVGRSQWHYGSYHLWGDVPALMPITHRGHKNPGFRFDGAGGSFQTASVEGTKVGGLDWNKRIPGQAFNTHAERATKNSGGSWFAIGSPGQKVVGRNPDGRPLRNNARDALVDEGRKQGGDWFSDPKSGPRQGGNKSTARKAASARIAKIPFPLASHIARVYRPLLDEAA